MVEILGKEVGHLYKQEVKIWLELLNELGIDVCTGHWEFTYKDTEVMENLELLNADFVAQNIKS